MIITAVQFRFEMLSSKLKNSIAVLEINYNHQHVDKVII